MPPPAADRYKNYCLLCLKTCTAKYLDMTKHQQASVVFIRKAIKECYRIEYTGASHLPTKICSSCCQITRAFFGMKRLVNTSTKSIAELRLKLSSSTTNTSSSQSVVEEDTASVIHVDLDEEGSSSQSVVEEVDLEQEEAGASQSVREEGQTRITQVDLEEQAASPSQSVVEEVDLEQEEASTSRTVLPEDQTRITQVDLEEPVASTSRAIVGKNPARITQIHLEEPVASTSRAVVGKNPARITQIDIEEPVASTSRAVVGKTPARITQIDIEEPVASTSRAVVGKNPARMTQIHLEEEETLTCQSTSAEPGARTYLEETRAGTSESLMEDDPTNRIKSDLEKQDVGISQITFKPSLSGISMEATATCLNQTVLKEKQPSSTQTWTKNLKKNAGQTVLKKRKVDHKACYNQIVSDGPNESRGKIVEDSHNTISNTIVSQENCSSETNKTVPNDLDAVSPSTTTAKKDPNSSSSQTMPRDASLTFSKTVTEDSVTVDNQDATQGTIFLEEHSYGSSKHVSENQNGARIPKGQMESTREDAVQFNHSINDGFDNLPFITKGNKKRPSWVMIEDLPTKNIGTTLDLTNILAEKRMKKPKTIINQGETLETSFEVIAKPAKKPKTLIDKKTVKPPIKRNRGRPRKRSRRNPTNQVNAARVLPTETHVAPMLITETYSVPVLPTETNAARVIPTETFVTPMLPNETNAEPVLPTSSTCASLLPDEKSVDETIHQTSVNELNVLIDEKRKTASPP